MPEQKTEQVYLVRWLSPCYSPILLCWDPAVPDCCYWPWWRHSGHGDAYTGIR